MRLIPGPKRLNLHAIYLESDTPVSRDQIKPEHFKNWVEWAKANQLGLDFNPSCFSHPLSADGFTLSHADDSIRQFWIDHCKASRRVSAYFGEQLGTPSVMNIWIPDGMKDITVDRLAPRQRLLAALDEVISEKLDPAHHIDAVESKLFGIGAESYTVGSNEFYMGYATSRQTALCLSTDKAAYPINAMGKSKAMMESIIYANARNGAGRTTICCTRYGNVMCSRGSVIPLFIDRIRKGEPLTVTDPNMTRFLMNLDEAVDLVQFAFEHVWRQGKRVF